MSGIKETQIQMKVGNYAERKADFHFAMDALM
jgi:hypothetical protein